MELPDADCPPDGASDELELACRDVRRLEVVELGPLEPPLEPMSVGGDIGDT